MDYKDPKAKPFRFNFRLHSPHVLIMDPCNIYKVRDSKFRFDEQKDFERQVKELDEKMGNAWCVGKYTANDFSTEANYFVTWNNVRNLDIYDKESHPVTMQIPSTPFAVDSGNIVFIDMLAFNKLVETVDYEQYVADWETNERNYFIDLVEKVGYNGFTLMPALGYGNKLKSEFIGDGLYVVDEIYRDEEGSNALA